MPHIVHDPTVTETIAVVEALLDAYAELPSARASFNGAALQLVELIAEAVEQRVARRKVMEEQSTQLRLAAESDKIAS